MLIALPDPENILIDTKLSTITWIQPEIHAFLVT